MENKNEIRVLDNQGYIKLIDCMVSEIDIINAARVSYNKYIDEMKKRDYKLLNYLIEHKHTSPFEMVVFKFEVYCPLFIARQWMRHRTWSYNEVSRRYTSENIEIYVPSNLRTQDKNNKQKGTGEIDEQKQEILLECMKNYSHSALNTYNKLLEDGVCREQARMILPQSMMTKFIGKADLHNLIHFLKLRVDEHSQEEIRVYAEAIIELIKPVVPTVVEKLFTL